MTAEPSAGMEERTAWLEPRARPFPRFPTERRSPALRIPLRRARTGAHQPRPRLGGPASSARSAAHGAPRSSAMTATVSPSSASHGRAGTPRRASTPTTRSPGSTRTAGITNETGKTVFEQKDVEVPKFWSQLATNVVVSKYFRGHVGTPERETQRQAAHRPRRQHHRGLGGDPALLRHGRGPRRVPGRADPPPRPPEDGLQLAGLVQRRRSSRSRSARPASSTRSRTR